MNKKFGKNEASGVRRKNSVMMIISILAVAIFIGTAIQPAMADSLPTQGTKIIDEEENIPIIPNDTLNKDGLCDTCAEAAEFAVNHMIEYVKVNAPKDHEHYLWRIEYVILMWQGLNEGIKMSGFSFKINQVKLMAKIEYWVGEITGGQILPVTQFIANLTAYAVGIIAYLVTLCDQEDPLILARPIQSPVRIMPRFYLIIVVLQLLRI